MLGVYNMRSICTASDKRKTRRLRLAVVRWRRRGRRNTPKDCNLTMVFMLRYFVVIKGNNVQVDMARGHNGGDDFDIIIYVTYGLLLLPTLYTGTRAWRGLRTRHGSKHRLPGLVCTSDSDATQTNTKLSVNFFAIKISWCNVIV